MIVRFKRASASDPKYVLSMSSLLLLNTKLMLLDKSKTNIITYSVKPKFTDGLMWLQEMIGIKKW